MFLTVSLFRERENRVFAHAPALRVAHSFAQGVAAIANNRSRHPHLEQRATGFYWRRRWPKEALVHWNTAPSGNVYICLPLRSDLLRDAKTVAARITWMSDLVFAALAENDMPITTQTAQNLLSTAARLEIEAAELARALAPGRTLADADYAQARERPPQDMLRRALMLGDTPTAGTRL